MGFHLQVKAWKAHLEATKEERAGQPHEPGENVESMQMWPEIQVDIKELTEIDYPEAVKRARITKNINCQDWRHFVRKLWSRELGL